MTEASSMVEYCWQSIDVAYKSINLPSDDPFHKGMEILNRQMRSERQSNHLLSRFISWSLPKNTNELVDILRAIGSIQDDFKLWRLLRKASSKDQHEHFERLNEIVIPGRLAYQGYPIQLIEDGTEEGVRSPDFLLSLPSRNLFCEVSLCSFVKSNPFKDISSLQEQFSLELLTELTENGFGVEVELNNTIAFGQSVLQDLVERIRSLFPKVTEELHEEIFQDTIHIKLFKSNSTWPICLLHGIVVDPHISAVDNNGFPDSYTIKQIWNKISNKKKQLNAYSPSILFIGMPFDFGFLLPSDDEQRLLSNCEQTAQFVERVISEHPFIAGVVIQNYLGGNFQKLGFSTPFLLCGEQTKHFFSRVHISENSILNEILIRNTSPDVETPLTELECTQLLTKQSNFLVQ